MTDCDRALELISAGLDGALTPEEKDWLEKHLEHCPACRALDADFAALHQLLPTLAPEPPAELKERIMDAVRAEKTVPFPAREQKKPRRWKAWVSVAAVAALVFLGGRAALPALNSGGTPCPRRQTPPPGRSFPRQMPPRRREGRPPGGPCHGGSRLESALGGDPCRTGPFCGAALRGNLFRRGGQSPGGQQNQRQNRQYGADGGARRHRPAEDGYGRRRGGDHHHDDRSRRGPAGRGPGRWRPCCPTWA